MHLAKALDNGQAVSAQHFQEHDYKPFKYIASWIRSKERKYGQHCQESQAWAKLVATLQTDVQMRRVALECMTTSKRFEEDLPECIVIIEELDLKLKGAASVPSPMKAQIPIVPRTEPQVLVFDYL